MKIAKRVVGITLGLLIGVIVGIFIYLQVRNQKAMRQLVHQESTAILKVAVDDIMVDVLKNALLHSSLLQEKYARDPYTSSDWTVALNVPSTIYFFSIQPLSADMYAYLRVKDEDKLIAIILHELQLDSTDIHRSSDHWTLQSRNGKINFWGNKDNVLVGIGPTAPTVAEGMSKVWEGRDSHMQKVQDIEGLDIDALRGDVVYYSLLNKDIGTLNFENGSLHFSATVDAQGWNPSRYKEVRKRDEMDVLYGYCTLDIGSFLANQVSFFRSNIELRDFLTNSYAGYFDMQWKEGAVLQQDTVITYDYDDNFEAIEKKELREEKVPYLVFTLKESTDLNAQIPDKLFYKISKTSTKGYLVLSTALEELKPLVLVPTDHFVELYYKYDDTVTPYLSSFPALEAIASFSVTGKMHGSNQALLEGEVKFKEVNLHPILQLF